MEKAFNYFTMQILEAYAAFQVGNVAKAAAIIGNLRGQIVSDNHIKNGGNK